MEVKTNAEQRSTLNYREWEEVIDNAHEWSASHNAPLPRQKRGRKPIPMARGTKVGVYTVLDPLDRSKHRRRYFRCMCPHKHTKDISGWQLRYWLEHNPPSRCDHDPKPARGACKRGPYRLLTNNEAEDIRRTYASGDVTQEELARRYSVSRLTISNAIHNRTHNGEPRRRKRRKTRYYYDEGLGKYLDVAQAPK